MSKVKRNPTITLRRSDLNRMHKQWTTEATELLLAAVLTVLRDKEGWGVTRLTRTWKNVDKLMGEIAEGRLNVYDLKKVLADEVGIAIQLHAEK